MNVFARTTPPAEGGIEEPPEAKPGIRADEKARRKAAVDYARGSVRLEGFIVSPFAEELNRRYVEGEITRSEMTAALLVKYARRES